MTQQLARVGSDGHAAMEALVVKGDVSKLSPEERWQFYVARCNAAGLDPASQPFDLIPFQGKLTLYANKSCAEQLRQIHGISLEVVSESTDDNGIYKVRVKATDRSGRFDTATAALPTKGLNPEALALAIMKCETKAKRRATFSLTGLSGVAGIIAESEEYDTETGEIIEVESSEVRRKQGLKQLHAAGREAGLNHEQLREVAKEQHPEIGSLTELDGEQLEAVADVVKAQASKPEPIEAEYVEATPEPEPPAPADEARHSVLDAWLPLIETADTLEAMAEIGMAIRDASITSKEEPELLREFTAKNNRLKIAHAQEVRAAQEAKARDRVAS